MRRSLLAISTTIFLLAPMAASAAYDKPSDLLSTLQASAAARSFSLSAHAGSDGTYVTVWGNGSEQGEDGAMQLWMAATIDIAHGGMKARLKGQIMIIDSMMYLKIGSVEGTDKKALSSLATIAKQKKWIVLPMDNNSMADLTGTDIGVLSSTDPAEADGMLMMQNQTVKGTTTYHFQLLPDFAATVAKKLRLMLNDTEPVSTDFFPWRELAESIHFDMSIMTNAKDQFLSSDFTLSMKGKNSYFNSKGTEKALSKALTLTTPKDTISLENLSSTFGDLSGKLPSTPSMMPSSMKGNFNAVDQGNGGSMNVNINAECLDPNTTAMRLLMLQRTGDCPTKKTSTRAGGW